MFKVLLKYHRPFCGLLTADINLHNLFSTIKRGIYYNTIHCIPFALK